MLGCPLLHTHIRGQPNSQWLKLIVTHSDSQRIPTLPNSSLPSFPLIALTVVQTSGHKLIILATFEVANFTGKGTIILHFYTNRRSLTTHTLNCFWERDIPRCLQFDGRCGVKGWRAQGVILAVNGCKNIQSVISDLSTRKKMLLN